MKPLRLEIQAFGPFPGHEVVDFAPLEAKGLFVVTGPTGAGKTSLFDALCFALYGRLPGDRPEAEARSHHAAPPIEPFVQLDFAVGDDHFRVRRTPTHDRPKHRGTGTTRVQHAATLHRITPAGETRPLAGRASECTERCTELVGLSCEEFQRVVLLPQGRFASFLLARSSEREQVLRQLFGGLLYERATDHLRRVVKDLEGEVGDVEREIQRQLLNAAEALHGVGLGPADADIHTGTDAPPEPGAIEALLAAGSHELPARRAHVARLQSRASAAAVALERSTELAQRWDTRRVASERLVELDAQRDERLADLTRADAAARARPVARAQQELAAALDAAQHSAEALQDGRRQARGAASELLHLGTVTADHVDMGAAALASAVVATRTVLDQHRERLRDALAAAEAARQAEQAATRAADDHARTEHEVEHADAAATAAALERARLAPLAAGLVTAQEACAQAERCLEQRLLLDARRSELLEAEHDEAQAHRRYLEVMARYVATQAPRLALSLVDGEPCPVCGSADHPEPARPDDDTPLDHRELDAARVAHGTAQQRLAALSEAVSALQSQLGPHCEAPAAELQAAVASAQQAVSTALDAAEQLTQIDQQVEEVEHRLATLRALATEQRDRATEAAALAAAARHRASELGALAEGLDPDQLEHDAALISRLDELATCLPALEAADAAARGALDGARRARDEAVRHSGFEHLDHALGAVLDARTETELRRAHEAWERDRTEVTATLRHLSTHALPDERPDLDADQGVHDTLTAEHLSAQRELTRLEAALERAATAVTQARAAADAAAEVRERFQTARKVASTCNGEGPQRITLATWVLAHELDRVTAHANVHLAQMTGHRYRLRRVDRLGGHGKAGLELVVHDAHTGRERPTTTLSGGEQFQASLALALGLADVVSHGGVSGGHRFEALFVDEGFGSLDPDALEQAIAALVQLRATGRMVGAITHVEAMKHQLPVGIEVRPRPDGRGSTVALA